MNPLEIDKALVELLLEKIKKSRAKLSTLPKEAKNERKAVQIELGMYNLFVNFGFLYTLRKGDTYEQQRNHVLRIREKMTERMNLFIAFPKIKKAYDVADEVERKCIIAALHSEMHMRNSFYNKYLKDLEAAKQYNDVYKSFEIGLKVSVLEDGFRLLEKYRQENGIYPGMFEEELSE